MLKCVAPGSAVLFNHSLVRLGSGFQVGKNGAEEGVQVSLDVRLQGAVRALFGRRPGGAVGQLLLDKSLQVSRGEAGGWLGCFVVIHEAVIPPARVSQSQKVANAETAAGQNAVPLVKLKSSTRIAGM